MLVKQEMTMPVCLLKLSKPNEAPDDGKGGCSTYLEWPSCGNKEASLATCENQCQVVNVVNEFVYSALLGHINETSFSAWPQWKEERLV